MHKSITVRQTFRFLYLKFTVYGTMLYLQAGWARILFLVCNFYCSLLFIVKEIDRIVPCPKVVLASRRLCYWSNKLSSFYISFTKEATLCSYAEQMEHCFREEILIQKGFQISLHWTDKRNTFPPSLRDNIQLHREKTHRARHSHSSIYLKQTGNGWNIYIYTVTIPLHFILK